MKITGSDLRYLAVPGLVALIVILAGLGTVLVTQDFLADARAQLDRAQAERAAIQTKLLHATEEEREIRASLGDYWRMRERGVIASEQRLDWIEAVTQIKSQRGIHDIRYAIQPQRPLEYPGFKKTTGIEFLDSRMKLEADLLHEGDLLTILADLRQKLAPYVIVRSCSLQRSAQARADAYGPHVRAECNLDLVTIHDPAEATK